MGAHHQVIQAEGDLDGLVEEQLTIEEPEEVHGYIACPRLSNKHMAGFNVTASNDVATRTITLTNEETQVSETPETDKAKIGDGYVKITKIN